jgi:hypothetical protein
MVKIGAACIVGGFAAGWWARYKWVRWKYKRDMDLKNDIDTIRRAAGEVN